jgi:hypothetical protein
MLLVSCREQSLSSIQIAETSPENALLTASSCQVATIGRWQDEGDPPRIISIRNYAGSYYMISEYPDGSSDTVTLGVKNVDGMIRLFEDIENFTGGYWRIAENRDLEYFEGDKLIKTLPILE